MTLAGYLRISRTDIETNRRKTDKCSWLLNRCRRRWQIDTHDDGRSVCPGGKPCQCHSAISDGNPIKSTVAGVQNEWTQPPQPGKANDLREAIDASRALFQD